MKKEGEHMKGYKGFNKDLKCLDFQYEIGKTYETDEVKLCNKGFHFCEAPLDVLRHYGIKEGNRFCEVEADSVSDERDDDTKRVAKKLTVGAEIGLPGLIKAHIEYTKSKAESGTAGGNRSNLAGGDWSNLAGGNRSNLAGGGWSNLAGGGWSNLAGGGWSNLAGGYWSNLAGGNSSNLAGGDRSNLAGGDRSNLAGGGWSNLAGGDSSLIVGRDGSKAKAGKDSVIVLSEWSWIGDEYKPVNVKAVIVDGEKIKADTWYKLVDGKFVEVEE